MRVSKSKWGVRIILSAAVMPAMFVATDARAEPLWPQMQQSSPQSGQQKPPDLSRPNGPNVIDPNQNKPDQANAPVPGTPGKPEAAPTPGPATADWTAPLHWYEGTWQVKSDQAGSKPTIETDNCQVSGKRFYECEHIVDGETVALRLYVPGDQPGHYFTQSILPSGTAIGRNDLQIEGNTWILSNKSESADGAVSYQRITLVFSGKAHDTVRYSVERSDDGLHWQTQSTGAGRKTKS
jgi:hypothetical protein